MKIFVQIASYRDPELENTIKSIIENAKKPNNLRIGICRQYHPEDGFDTLNDYIHDTVHTAGKSVTNKYVVQP